MTSSRLSRLCAGALIAGLALSCASANKLSQRSERELASGDLRRAYEHARRAVEKDPAHPRARAAYLAAAARLVDDREARILSIAVVDTEAAAVQILDLADLRSDLLRHEMTPPPDSAFDRHETAIRVGAAAIRYRAGERAMAERAPKVAWAEFRSAQRYVPGYRDAPRREEQAFEQALARVAIIPFEDQVGVPGLARGLADRTFEELGHHVRPDQFTFTQLIHPGRVYEHVTVAELGHLTRDEAVRVGRHLGADQVVTGRIYGLRASTNTISVRQTIFRKVVERDTSGARRERFDEIDFHAVERERTVTVHYDVEVVDTEDEASLVAYSDAVEGYARVVFTDFRPTGNCADYCVVPPRLARSDPARAKRLESEWTRHFGTWTLPALLEQARKDGARLRYSASDRGAFFGDCHERPVWLGGLPEENDMAAIALDVIWQPVLGMLKELDAK